MKKFLSIFLVAFCLLGVTAALAISYEAQKATFSIYIDGDKFTPDNPAVVIDGTTYLSLVDLADALGVEVNWNNKLSRVEIETNSSEDDYYYYEYYDYYYDDEDTYSEEEEDYEDDYYYDDEEISLEFCINWLSSYLNSDSSTTSASSTTSSSTDKFVGSKSTKKYHTTDCSWAKKISSDNRTYFATAKKAESAGYTACMTCIP